MKLANVSKDKLEKSLKHWEIDKDYADPMINYLVHGFSPGSFFTSVLANDFVDAIGRSHPGNSVPALKNLVGWIVNDMPREAWGSYDVVADWLSMQDVERREILEDAGLIFTERQETWETLKEA
jgi:hypothetical protein